MPRLPTTRTIHLPSYAPAIQQLSNGRVDRVLDSGVGELLGLTALDLAVLSFLYDLGLVPPAWHRKTADVVRQIFDSGLCGVEDGYRVLQRLGATWLMPLRLVDPHGNLGSMYEPGAKPMYTEVRLTAAGAMAVEAHRGDLPILPIGLINGNLPVVLGLDFELWPHSEEDGSRSGVSRPRFRPGFNPAGLISALNALAERRRTTSTELAQLIGPPWLGPFETPSEPFSKLLETGEQLIRLTPRRAQLEDWAHPPAEVLLDLGAPLLDILWEWIAETGDRAPGPPVLDRLTARPDGS